MGVAFNADSVWADDNPECPQVVFAYESTADPHQLEFVRLDGDGSPPEVVCACDQLGIISGIIQVRLTPRQVVVTFADGSRAAGKTQAFVVGYCVTARERDGVRRAMKRIFRGTRLFVDDAATGLGLLRAIVVGPPTPTSELLVVPTYVTVVGAIFGGFMGAERGPWCIPAGVLLGASFGFVWGLLQGLHFRGLHKYK